MNYQSQQQGEEIHNLYLAKMKDDSFARAQVLEFTKLNPPDKKFQRKQLMDWVGFKKVHGVRVSHKEGTKDKPMTEKAFKVWATKKQGLSDTEADSEWKKYLNDPKIDRDNDGLLGALQLWIPKFNYRSWERDTFVDNVVEQGSKPLRNAKEDDVELLKTHAHRQDVSFSEDFLKKTDKASIAAKRALEVGASAAGGDAGSGKVSKRLKKSFNFDRDIAKLDKSMELDLKKLDAATNKTLNVYDKAIAALAQAELSQDRALSSYVRGLQFRRQVMHRLQDDVATVVVLADGPPAAPTPSAAPSTPCVSSSPTKEPPLSASGPAASPAIASLSGDAYKTAVRAASVAQLVEEFRNRKPFEGDPASFKTYKELKAMKAEVYEVDGQEKYEEVVVAWEASVKIAEQLTASVQQSATDVINHLAAKKRDEARQAKSAVQASQAAELKKAREEARKAAEEPCPPKSSPEKSDASHARPCPVTQAHARSDC